MTHRSSSSYQKNKGVRRLSSYAHIDQEKRPAQERLRQEEAKKRLIKLKNHMTTLSL